MERRQLTKSRPRITGVGRLPGKDASDLSASSRQYEFVCDLVCPLGDLLRAWSIEAQTEARRLNQKFQSDRPHVIQDLFGHV